MAEPSRYDPANPPQGLEGLTPAFIADLRDLVANYGADVRAVEGLRRISLPTPLPSQVTVTVPPSPLKSMSVRPVPADTDMSFLCLMLLDDEAHSYILWDRRCTVDDVRKAMAEVDAEMAVCRDPATGRRRRVLSDRYAAPPLEVAKVFDRPGKTLPLPAGIEPDAVRYQFDRPDDLAVVADAGGSGRQGLCRKADIELGASGTDETVARVLARYGVRTLAEIERMSRDTLERMLREIEDALVRSK